MHSAYVPLRAVLCAVLIIGSALPAWAAQVAKVRTPSLSVALPHGWAWNAEASLTAFYAPGGIHSLALLIIRYEMPDAFALLKKHAPDTPIYDIGAGQGYLYESREGARVWAVLTTQGVFCEAIVKNRFDGIRAMLASLTAHTPLLRPVVEGVRVPAVMDWLTFTTPRLPAPLFTLAKPLPYKENAPVQPFEGFGLRAVLPETWTVAYNEGVVTFASPDRTQQAHVHVFPLSSARADAHIVFAKAYAKKIGAYNIREEEGLVECMLPGGVNGVFSRHGKRCLLVLTQGESVPLHVLVQSVEPQ